MERLTTDKMVSEMGMFELAHNGCYIDENFSARYRDFDTDIDARELTREIMRGFGLWEIDDNEMLSDEIFDDTIMDNLMYCPKELDGLIALFYRNLWAMAELRERLKKYEDAEEQGLLLRLPCKVGDTVYLVDFDENEYDEATIESIEIDKDGFTINSDYEIGTDLDAEYVCLTKEEAEQALAEIERGDEHESKGFSKTVGKVGYAYQKQTD